MFFLSSCYKDFDNTSQVSKIVLPPCTDTGANTFGFMMNDTPWTVFGKHKTPEASGGNWIDNKLQISTDPSFSIGKTVHCFGIMSIVKNSVPIKESIITFIFSPTEPYTKTYYLSSKDTSLFIVNDPINYKGYVADSLNPIVLNISKFEKIDISNRKICSGSFYGVLYNYKNKKDSLVITNGCFDLKVVFP